MCERNRPVFATRKDTARRPERRQPPLQAASQVRGPPPYPLTRSQRASRPWRRYGGSKGASRGEESCTGGAGIYRSRHFGGIELVLNLVYHDVTMVVIRLHWI